MKPKITEEHEIDRVCLYCERGCPVPGESGDELVICEKKGLVASGHVCGRFRYDLLKRDPRRISLDPEHETVELDD